jgi:hypothetical protein
MKLFGVAVAVLMITGLMNQPVAALEDQSVIIGRVLDAQTGGPLSGVRVTAGSREVQTDPDGSFRLELPPGPASLTATAPGHAAKTVDIQAGDDKEVVIALAPGAAQFREQVEVIDSASSDKDSPASEDVRPTEVMKAAGALDNVFRVLQTLPGVTATQEYSSRISVRGGGPDENLTIMDGVEISDPYRLQGLVAAFNPEMIESFTLDTGSFGVAHGDRLSSLLTVENRAGNGTRSFGGSAALSLTDANVVAEGKLPGPATGSWIVTLRRTYYDLVADKIVGTQLPGFNDIQTKVVWEPHPGSRLSLFALRSRESADASITSSDHQGTFLDDARNDVLAATFESRLASRLTSRTIASWYRNPESFDVTAQFQDNNLRSNAPDDSGFARRNIAFARDLTVRDIAFRQELNLQVSQRNTLQLGAETHRVTTGVSWRITGNQNSEAANGSSIRGGAGLPNLLDSSVASGRSGVWLQDHVQVSNPLAIAAGLRVDHSEINAQTDLSPRVDLRLDLSNRTRVLAAFGQYTQSPGYDKLAQSDYFVDLSHTGTLSLPNELSLHSSLALQRDLGPGVQAQLQAYYKSFNHITVGSLETDAEREARVAQYDFPADLQSSVPTAPLITSTPSGDGRGRAYGFDFYLTKRATSTDTRLTGWLSYTYGHSSRESYGLTYPFDYDRRHAVSVVDNLRISGHLDLSTTLRIDSGFPYTPVIGLRVAAVEDDQGRLVPQRDPSGLLVYTVDRGGVANLNSARLPVFARLDLRASYRPKGAAGRWLLYLDIINVTNRKNAGSVDTTLDYDPSSTVPKTVNQYGGALPILPSFGVRFHF